MEGNMPNDYDKKQNNSQEKPQASRKWTPSSNYESCTSSGKTTTQYSKKAIERLKDRRENRDKGLMGDGR
jgi:hypothetical protein